MDLPVLYLLCGWKGSAKQRPRDADLELLYCTERLYGFARKMYLQTGKIYLGATINALVFTMYQRRAYDDAECDKLVVLIIPP